MRQLILLLFIFAGYSVAQAQPFMVDTSYTDKHRPVHMKVYPNGKTIWISIKDSAGTSSYYANTFIQGSIQLTQSHITYTENYTGIVAFDWEDKLQWLELTQNADTLFIRWLACDDNGHLVHIRRSSLVLAGIKKISSGRFYDGRFLLVLEQYNTAGEARNLSLLEFDTLGQLVVNRPSTGTGNPEVIPHLHPILANPRRCLHQGS